MGKQLEMSESMPLDSDMSQTLHWDMLLTSFVLGAVKNFYLCGHVTSMTIFETLNFDTQTCLRVSQTRLKGVSNV